MRRMFFLGIIFLLIIFYIVGFGKFSLLKTVREPVIPISIAALNSSKEISRGDINKKQVIFTFDGGSGIQSADKILEVLAKHHVKGTFFLTGKMIEANSDLVKRIAAGNNEIFNHTYSHPYLTKLSDEEITEELSKMEKVVIGVTNHSSKPYFRPPYGDINEKVIAVAAQAGYQSVSWTVDALDWKESQGVTAEKVKQQIISNILPGTIYLMHIGDMITGDILDDVFTVIESRGYKIVSLTEGI